MCSTYANKSRLNNEDNLGDLYDHENLHFDHDLIRYSYELQEVRGNCLEERFGFANHLALIVCFIFYEKLVYGKPP